MLRAAGDDIGADPGEAVVAFHPRPVAKVVLVRPLGDVSVLDFGELVAPVAVVGIEQVEYTWLQIQPEMIVIGRAREQDPFYMYLLNGSQMIEQASNLALIDGLMTECIVV